MIRQREMHCHQSTFPAGKLPELRVACTQFSNLGPPQQNEMKCNQTKYFDLRQANSVVYRVGKNNMNASPREKS
jgi:hypothetical protein